ncbi:hypothetical protein OBBRIDRAFT_793861 [Obba rivulosa]|uniref:Protein prenyltransferase alpha subunit repeat-containing protein 1 n=1 Tax=Obba rivulosa TaxID=1052685 RepID=A0A8E2DJ00_9APHY|nr:hypothetical protein OBBRIDRAFT_793861 [Obba rivulosa]
MSVIKQLGALLNRPPKSIEIVPGDGSDWMAEPLDDGELFNEHQPFLLIEENLGVPEKVLYMAYIPSVELFAESRHCIASPSIFPADHDRQNLLHSSAVIVLANPAHQTALNARKWLVELSILEACKELDFITALLAVRNCAKQNLLWRYRRWLLLQVHKTVAASNDMSGLSEDTLLGLAMPSEAWRHELATTLRACEIYPRNYFAWSHRYLCMKTLCALSMESSDHAQAYQEVLFEELVAMKRWVELHVSDYSAMQYLCMLHSGIQSTVKHLPNLSQIAEINDADLVTHACTLIEAYPDHEALWLYLRGALISTGRLHATDKALRDATVKEMTSFAERFLSRGAEGEGAFPMIQHAVSAADVSVVRRHIGRVLAWLMRQIGNPSMDDHVIAVTG